MDKPKPKLLLVGWDAADWEHINPLLEQGHLPTLNTLINEGVMGNLATLHPVLSPMLWNSIATGKNAYKHGIYSFTEPDPHHGGIRAYSSASRKTKALWNILSQNGLRSNVVNWWASHPAEPINGCIVTNSVSATTIKSDRSLSIPNGTVHPPQLAGLIARCKVFAEELTGEQILPFVPLGREINQDEDHRLSVLADIVADMLTTHAAATAAMEAQPWDFTAVYYTAIDHMSHSFMPYHPPRLPWIPERDYELFKDVISSTYRFSDMMLRRLIELSGPDTNIIVCSDHGFQSRGHRPRAVPNDPTAPMAWHRQYGVFIAKGPDIKKDELVHGATLLDLAPTILSIFGLPVGRDMDGRVLGEIFARPRKVEFIESWDSVPGESGMHAADVPTSDAEGSDQVLNQLIALGYVEAAGGDKKEQAEIADRENRYNLASNLIWCGMHQPASEILLKLVGEAAWESRYLMSAVRCFLSLNNLTMAEKLLTAAFNLRETLNPNAIAAWAEILRRKGNAPRAHALLRHLEVRLPNSPTALTMIGTQYLMLRRLEDAERVFTRVIELHPENAEALLGLSSVHCRMGRNQETVDTALAAVALVYQLPKAHLNLGIALARSGQTERAVAALRTALEFNRNIRKAHRWLAMIYDRNPLTRAQADFHRSELERIAREQEESSAGTPAGPDALLDIPEIPPELERYRIVKKYRPEPASISQRSGRCFTLVSGLPRSGTSLMMQMLEAGGLEPKTDGERTADVDNPKGYYEWEAIKQISAKPHLLDEEGLEKKVIKAISMLLPAMPYKHEYRVIFMTRPIDEVIESQAKMIENRKSEGANLSPAELKAQLAAHREETIQWLAHHPRAKYLEVDYPSLVKDPDPYIKQIAEFLGPEVLPHPEKMRSVIDGSLYRKRSKSG